MELFLVSHVVSALFLCGLIWLIQLVHYPSFHYVEESKFVDFENFHTRRISYLVVPSMLIELGTGIWLCLQFRDDWLWWLNLFSIIGIWLSTICFSVPCHKILAKGKDSKVIRFLVISNWPRTCLWSFKILILGMALKELY